MPPPPDEDPLLATRTRQRVPVAHEAGIARVSTLTVLGHPDARRVGERALLVGLGAGESVSISRLTPRFVAPRGAPREGVSTAGPGRATPDEPRPLADAFLSRDPLATIERRDGVIVFSRGAGRGLVRVDGEVLDGARSIGEQELDAGVVVELDDRVVLLLHQALAASGRASARFGLVGDSDAMRQLRRDIDRLARTELRVLVRGATGTGKELAARALHDASARSKGPYEAINMAAIQPSLAASALFGHTRGAFSGAASDQDGHFVAADGGTLFLDEIGDTDVGVQAMLLRTLETKEVVRLGDRRPRKVDVRFLSATDADLEAAVSSGRFREPLLHRVAEATLRVPSLAERRDDIGRLIVHFARALLAPEEQARLLDDDRSEQPWLSAALVARLALAPWTGNVRQLQNVVRQLVVQGREEPSLAIGKELDGLFASQPAAAQQHASSRGAPTAARRDDSPPPRPTAKSRRPQEITDGEILAALEKTGFRRAAAADLLGIARSSLYARVAANKRLSRSSELTAEEVTAALEKNGGDLASTAAALEISPHGLKLRMHTLGVGPR